MRPASFTKSLGRGVGVFSLLYQACSAIIMMFRVDRTMMVGRVFRISTTHACVLFSDWGVLERRVGLLSLPAAFIANRPPSSAILGGHVIVISQSCSGVKALSATVTCQYKVTVCQQSRFDLPKLEASNACR
jgi:hypothetical protein